MTFRTAKAALGVSSTTVTKLSDAQRDQATQGAQLTEMVQTLYSLVLYDTDKEATLVAEGLDPAGRTKNAEYYFRVPPKVHEFAEPFASNVMNTQYHGKYVESYGSVIKSIRLSGTTGVRPNKLTSPTIPLLGISEDQINTLLGAGLGGGIRKIPSGEATGHDDIIFLRNIFRKYSDIKSHDLISGRVVMLWRNIKDADYWVVEPEDFRLSQSSSNPLGYEYSISLKTLACFDLKYTVSVDPLEQSRIATRMVSRLQFYGQNILNIFLTVSHQINRIQGYATFVSNVVLGPMLGVINGLNAVKTSAFGIFRGLRNQVLTLSENLDDAISRLLTFTVPQNPVIRGLRRAKLICARILSEPVASESAVRDVGQVLNRYATAYETPGTGTTARRSPDSSPTYIGSETSPASVGTDIVRPSEDIRDIALRLFGDRSRWRLIVALNRLRSPFISILGGPGVLAPGDSFLFPSDQERPSTLVGTQNPSSDETNGDPQANTTGQQAYGRDLRLKSVFIGTEEITDLQINQRGDISSIQGLANVEQAIRIKFSTEKGELAAHPKFGAKFSIGRKATPSSFNELRLNTLSTLLSDNRVASVRNLKFIAAGDGLAVSADVELTQAQDILNTSFALRRF